MKVAFRRTHRKLLFTFYRTHFLADTVITLSCLWILDRWGLVAFQGIFWLKIFSYAAIYYLIDGPYKNKYYYYLNLGLRKSALWAITLSLDLVIFISLIIFTYNI